MRLVLPTAPLPIATILKRYFKEAHLGGQSPQLGAKGNLEDFPTPEEESMLFSAAIFYVIRFRKLLCILVFLEYLKRAAFIRTMRISI
jgi:hypothetical protein